MEEKPNLDSPNSLILDINANYPTFILNGLYHEHICKAVIKSTIELLVALSDGNLSKSDIIVEEV